MKKLLLTLLSVGALIGLTIVSAIPVAAADSTGPQVQTLFAGKDIPIGTVQTWNDTGTLFVTFETTGGWELSETHLAVANSLEGIPQTKTGNPIPGKFEFMNTHTPSVTEFTYTIPISTDGTLFIAAHAAVQGESAWADGLQFEGKNWATYFTYEYVGQLSVVGACALIQANEENPDFVILDVRTPTEFSLGHLVGAVNLDYRTAPYSSGNAQGFTDAVGLLDTDDIYLVYCKTDGRAGYAVSIMKELGFTEVYNMDGGYAAWIGEPGLACPAGGVLGTWLLSVNDGAYIHDMVIETMTLGGGLSSYANITGTGGYPASGPPYDSGYDWTMTGQITGAGITMTITYSNSYTANITGTVSSDFNSMSGGAGTGGVINWMATRVS